MQLPGRTSEGDGGTDVVIVGLMLCCSSQGSWIGPAGPRTAPDPSRSDRNGTLVLASQSSEPQPPTKIAREASLAPFEYPFRHPRERPARGGGREVKM